MGLGPLLLRCSQKTSPTLLPSSMESYTEPHCSPIETLPIPQHPLTESRMRDVGPCMGQSSGARVILPLEVSNTPTLLTPWCGLSHGLDPLPIQKPPNPHMSHEFSQAPFVSHLWDGRWI